MPDGSSSEAPVMRPGPSFEKKPRTGPAAGPTSCAVCIAGTENFVPRSPPLHASHEVSDEADQEEDQKKHENELGNSGECNRDAAKSQQGRNQRNDKKHQRIVKHLRHLRKK